MLVGHKSDFRIQLTGKVQ